MERNAADAPRAPGKVVFVTGSSSGIGAATATRLAAEGHHVVLAARREGRLRALAQQIRDLGGSAEAHRLDVTEHAEVCRVVDQVVKANGRIDVMVNNAGVMPTSRLDALRVREWDEMVDVNIRGALHGIAAVLPHFSRQGEGHFVTVASTAAYVVVPDFAVYCGTKHAVRAITEGLRRESDPSIRVTTVSPGLVQSELTDTIVDQAARHRLVHRWSAMAMPADVVAAAISYAIAQPKNVDVNEIVIRPAVQRT